MGWKLRKDASMPYQNWHPFPDGTLVEVSNAYGDTRIAVSSDLWWGYERELGQVGEGVIVKARAASAVGQFEIFIF